MAFFAARSPEIRYQSAEEFLDAIVHLDQPAMADLPLPRLRTLGIAIALFAALVLALVAWQDLNRLRQVAPLTVPWQRLHIAPPDFATASFATAMTPPSAPPPPAARRPKVPRVARPAAAPTEAPAAAPAEAATVQDVDQPIAPQAAPAPKKRFWSKLNVFKKKSTDAQAKQ
jgi:hypothetical protein